VLKVLIKNISKQNLENEANAIWENLREGVYTLKFVDHKYFIKTFI
jgi:hypothetical protein